MGRVAALWDEWVDEDPLGTFGLGFGGNEPTGAAAYPSVPLPVVVEMWLGWWEAITGYVYVDEGISITRGIPDEGSAADPGQCSLVLNNRDGRFSPRNPTGPYYGLIGRNTPIRVKVDLTGIGGQERIRFVGEISEWPSRWDVSGRDVRVPVVAQGIRRRLQQGGFPVRSGPRRTIEASDPFSYWALDEGPLAESGRLTAGVGGDFTSLDWGDAVDAGSQELSSWLGTGVYLTLDTAIFAEVPFPASPTRVTIDAIYVFNGATSGTQSAGFTLAEVSDFATGSRWVAQINYTGSVADLTTGLLGGGGGFTTVVTDAVLDGPHHLRHDLIVSGGNVNYIAYLDGVELINASVAGDLSGYPFVRMFNDGANGSTSIWSDFTIWVDVTPPDVTEIAAAVQGYPGEQAHVRVARLCDESGVTYTAASNAGESVAMGPQARDPLADVLDECWVADMGRLYETRDESGLTFRTRTSMYNEAAEVVLSYDGAGEVAPPLEPTDDDQHVVNDVTARRKAGSQVRVVDEDSRMSVQPPPLGVGRYDTEVEVNVASDDQLLDNAGWRRHVGTWDEPRYPSVRVDMAALAAHSKTTLMAQVAHLDVGDRITLNNLPDWLPPDDVDLIVLGFTETIGHPIDWNLELICIPYGPLVVGVYAASTETPGPAEPKRYSPVESLVYSAFVAGTDTSLVVEDQEGGSDLWSTSADLPFDIRVAPAGATSGGVRLRVTNISAPTGARQTFTVQAAAINGVARTIPAGWQVSLWQPAVYAL